MIDPDTTYEGKKLENQICFTTTKTKTNNENIWVYVDEVGLYSILSVPLQPKGHT